MDTSKAFTTIWNDVVPDGYENLYEWHNREHMPERVSIPGFKRGRRFHALKGNPEFFILYEAEDISVLGGPEYFARLNNPTPWTKKSQQNFRNSQRSVCRVAFSSGAAMGGAALTVRYPPQVEISEAFETRVIEDILKPVAERPGIAAAHLAVRESEITGVETEEKRGRASPFIYPSATIIVEAVNRAILERIEREVLTREALLALGSPDEFDVGLYQHEFTLTADA
jgi:hypothetical protein